MDTQPEITVSGDPDEVIAELIRLRAALAEIAKEDGMPVGRAFPDNRKRLRALSNIARAALELPLLKN